MIIPPHGFRKLFVVCWRPLPGVGAAILLAIALVIVWVVGGWH
jgi:hypothetical protein